MKSGIDYDMDILCEDLSNALIYFNSIEKEEKEVDFNEVKRLISNIDSKRNELKNKYSSDLLNKNSQKVNFITKQIKNTLDSVVEHKEAERNSVGLELLKLNNKKKIATYIR